MILSGIVVQQYTVRIDLIVPGRGVRCVVVIGELGLAVVAVARLHGSIECLGFATVVDGATIL
jgi:hypothetical protein